MLTRFKQDELQEPFYAAYDQASLTADLVVRMDKIPAGKKVRVEHVQYINPTGLAGAAGNAFAGKVLKNSNGAGAGTLVATAFNTDTGAGGATLAADTWVTATLTATDADRVLAAGDTLDVFFDETGTATLPAGRIVIRGRYV